MQESCWWWQCSDWYNSLSLSLFPHLHNPFSSSLISLTVSVDVKHHVYLINMMPELSDRPRLVSQWEQVWHATFGHPTAWNHLLSIIEEQISWLRRRKHMYRYYILFAFILETGYFSNTCTKLYNKSQCWSQGDQTFLQYFHQVTTQSMMERLFFLCGVFVTTLNSCGTAFKN